MYFPDRKVWASKTVFCIKYTADSRLKRWVGFLYMRKILNNVTARTSKTFVPSTSHTFDTLGEETRAYYIHPPAHFGFSSHYPLEISKYLLIDWQMLTRGASAVLSGEYPKILQRSIWRHCGMHRTFFFRSLRNAGQQWISTLVAWWRSEGRRWEQTLNPDIFNTGITWVVIIRKNFPVAVTIMDRSGKSFDYSLFCWTQTLNP